MASIKINKLLNIKEEIKIIGCIIDTEIKNARKILNTTKYKLKIKSRETQRGERGRQNCYRQKGQEHTITKHVKYYRPHIL